MNGFVSYPGCGLILNTWFDVADRTIGRNRYPGDVVRGCGNLGVQGLEEAEAQREHKNKYPRANCAEVGFVWKERD